MITNPTRAEELIRRDLAGLQHELAAVEQQQQALAQRAAVLQATIGEWSALLADDPPPAGKE